MDLPTHGLLGATIAQAGFRARLGRRALGWGALAAMLPDADILFVPLLGPFGEFVCHRGPTHSFLVELLLAPLLGALLWSADRRRLSAAPSLGTWIGFFMICLFSHPLLDWFTIYGTQLFWPVTHHRFALNAVAIVDPLYSAVLVGGLGLSALLRRRAETGGAGKAEVVTGRGPASACAAALVLSTLYLGHGLWINERAQAMARRQLAAEGVREAEVTCYPTIFQTFLRRVIARTPTEVRVGMITMWKPGRVAWKSFSPPRSDLVDRFRRTPEGRLFEWFAMGQVAPHVAVTRDGAVVELDDIRYGFFGPPELGLRGIRASFDAAGRPLGPPVRYYRPLPERPSQLIVALWRATFGLPVPA